MAAELRWILLGLGAVFLVGLALWELRRPRHAARKSPHLPLEDAAWHDGPAMSAEEGLPLDVPDIRASDLRRDPPIVMLDDMTLVDEAEEGVQLAAEVAVDRPSAAQWDEPSQPFVTPEPEVQHPTPDAVPVSIQWPPDRQDRILWLRVVPGEGRRFGGRSLRQALNGCGLVHGPQDIFHWADDSGRVIASAANLLRPGSFDQALMDTQEFTGLHLFSVLPGPLPPLQTYDELLGLARDLATRLEGQVRDERGREVDSQAVDAQRLALSEVPADDGADA
ncbi:MAG: hypothetical protein RLZZ393_2231 [Pseudomonadota bacterium]|jgi:cell division protein ZipA